MKTIIGILIIAFVVLFAGVQLFGAQIVAGVIEGATGAKASVKRIHLKLSPFEVGIYGTRIHNLEGFQEPEFISIPEIFVRVRLMDLLKGTAHIEKISLDLDHITFEKAQNGKVNLKELMDRSKQKQKEAASKPSPPEPEEKKPEAPRDAKPGMKTQIDEVVLSLGSLTYVDYGTGQRVAKNIDLKVEREVLRNVTDTYSLTQQVIIVILKRIGLSTLGLQMDIFKGNFEEQAGQLLNQAKDKFSEMFN